MEVMKNLIQSKPKRLAESIKKTSKELKSEKNDQKGSLPVYKIPLKMDKIDIQGCRRFFFGKEHSSNKKNRTIMVLGATGAGKSTLINGIINYIVDVKWEDSFRFKLVDESDITASQAQSQTSEVTVYKLNYHDGFKCRYSLTIIDTPGFGDTRGIDRDREITEQLHNLFSSQDGVTDIDAVCFVAQAALARLTPSQKYVFDSVLSIFGKDVADNIRILVTFADGQQPPVLEAINASEVPCPKTDKGVPVHFKFNNSALFADNSSSDKNSSDDDEDGDFDKMFWNMGTKSMQRFFRALDIIETKSLTMTKQVLSQRQELENSVEHLQMQVKVGISTLEEINKISEILKTHETEIYRNKDFTFEVPIKTPVQVEICGTGQFLTNCQQCSYTCHFPCIIANDKDKRGCGAMDQSTGYCKYCPGKCFWSMHFNQKYRWEYKDIVEKRTLEDLKQKYLKATKEKEPVQALIEKLKTDYDALQDKVVKLMETSAECLNKLKEIALKPNPLSTPEYIDMLIEGEKADAKPGYKERINSLKDMKQKAEYMAKVQQRTKLLPRTNSECESYQK